MPLDGPIRLNALTGITDEKGVRFATFAYGGGSGKASSTIHAGSHPLHLHQRINRGPNG